ncbi:hypothetical protein JHW31_15935 [Chryseobacterium indologenes]|nr:hypothetical protein JHW31_15935 [Chryseobacterium indologenes]
MRQQVTYGGNFGSDQQGQFTKFYSEDGSFEVIKNNATGQEKHILYIGGTPYESNIVYLKDFTESSGSYKFLHKDYIGSILAISDEAGNKLEQRHFDAWGGLAAVAFGNNGAVITDKNVINNSSLLLDRGYTSHEHFAEVGIIHMNGRLYDPLLRRFLNADENIQDPTNTQNYNKYGYVMNNPLMYNDPSGEFLFAPFIALISKAVFSAILSSAILYTATGLIKGDWNVNGFFRTLTSASITAIATAGISAIFHVSSFLGMVGVGALTGGVSGGIGSMINGSNFLEGVAKGAVIGAVVAGVSYTVNFYANAKTERLTEADLNLSDGQNLMSNPSTDPDVLNDRIQTFRNNNYTDTQVKRYGVGRDKLDVSSINNPGGYMEGGVIAETTPNFFTNKSTITYSSRAANTPYLLGKTMAHETAHAYVYKLTRAIPFSGNRMESNLADGRLDTVEHLAIKKLENIYYKINLNGVDMKSLNIVPLNKINSIINGLSPTMQSQVKSWTEKLYEIFNRKVTYQGISW